MATEFIHSNTHTYLGIYYINYIVFLHIVNSRFGYMIHFVNYVSRIDVDGNAFPQDTNNFNFVIGSKCTVLTDPFRAPKSRASYIVDCFFLCEDSGLIVGSVLFSRQIPGHLHRY